MSDELSRYLQYAQLSWAAYTPLDNTFNGPIPANQLTTPDIGFPTELANQFSARYTVLSHFEDSAVGLGFSATLFEKVEANLDGSHDKILAIRGTNGPGDLLVDLVNVALAGSTTLNPQYIALREYIGGLSADSNLLGTGNFTVTGHSLGGFLAQGLMADDEFKTRIDQVYTYNAPGLGGAAGSILEALGVPNPLIDPADAAKVTNLVASNGLSPIAGLGDHIGQVVPVFIEAGLPLDNHRITTLTDALAVYDLFGRLDAQVQAQPVTDILNALSKEPATSLEQAVVALQTLLAPTPQPLTLQTGDRDALYNAIQTLSTNSHVDGTKVVISLVGESASDLQTMAQFNSTLGLATRYALRELNPFVIAGNAAIYSLHNQGGTLELFDSNTGTGELTTEYVTDRADFLAKKMEINTTDSGLLTSLTNSFNDVHFKDYQSGYEISAGLFAQIMMTPQEFLFGSANSETLTGNSENDRLYGGGGADVLIGQGGTDHLEGNQGNDRLSGGAGDNDQLIGGSGFDTYVYNTGDGTDTVNDRDDVGRLLINGQLLSGGIRRAGDAADTFYSTDNAYTFVQSGTALTINGQLTVTDWQPGDLGVTLRDLSTLPTGIAPVIDYNNGLPTEFYSATHESSGPNGAWGFVAQSDLVNYVVTGGSGPDELYADTVVFHVANQVVYGGAGSDRIRGALNDRLFGEAGDDVLYEGGGDDQQLSNSRDRVGKDVFSLAALWIDSTDRYGLECATF